MDAITRLVLSRKPGESVVIDTPQGRITVTYVRLQSGQVLLAFDAPRSIPINREEVHQAKQGEAHGK